MFSGDDCVQVLNLKKDRKNNDPTISSASSPEPWQGSHDPGSPRPELCFDEAWKGL